MGEEGDGGKKELKEELGEERWEEERREEGGKEKRESDGWPEVFRKLGFAPRPVYMGELL